MAEGKRKGVMGKILISIGLILKVVQIVATAFGVKELGGTVWTGITACFLAGGLFVFALERRGVTATLACICGICVLLSMVKTGLSAILYGALFLMLITFGLMLFTLRRKAILFGLLTLGCTALLVLCALKVIVLTVIPGTALLALMYLLMAAGILV